MITQEKLKKVLDYNPKTGLFVNKVGRVVGCITKRGYVQISIDNKAHLAHRLAWLYVYGEFPKEQLDHINHVKSDNRLDNLREVNTQDNARNISKPITNTSGHVGVYWREKTKRWRARIKVDGRLLHLGYFAQYHEAVNARKNAEVLYGFHENHGKDL